MEPPRPTAEHAWLTRLLGRWTSVSEHVPGHEDHPITHGEENVLPLGALWIQADGDTGYGRTQMTLGFDPRTGRFVGTFVGAEMTHLWVYDGALVPGEDRLQLEADGPSFLEPGAMCRYRDEIVLLSPDERLLQASIQRADGSWELFMQTRYRRA